MRGLKPRDRRGILLEQVGLLMYLRTMSVERRPVWTMITRSEAPPAAALVASRRVYDHLRWLIDMLGADLPVHVVRAMRPDGTPAHIREDTARE